MIRDLRTASVSLTDCLSLCLVVYLCLSLSVCLVACLRLFLSLTVYVCLSLCLPLTIFLSLNIHNPSVCLPACMSTESRNIFQASRNNDGEGCIERQRQRQSQR